MEGNWDKKRKGGEMQAESRFEPSKKKEKVEKEGISMPKKSKYRMRAHINPLNEIKFPL